MKISLIAIGFLFSTSFALAGSASVYFISPKPGAEVPTKFHVKFGVKGMKVEPAGNMTENTGHHHLIVDGEPTPEGTVVPADATHIHFGKGQTETDLELPPGKHTLTLQFANGAHQSYGKAMSATTTVQVKH